MVSRLSGEADAGELAELEAWLAADPSHQHYFEQFSSIWKESRQLAQTSAVDENLAWEKFLQRIEQPVAGRTTAGPETAAARSARVLPLVSRWVRFAAILLLVVGIGTAATLLIRNLLAPAPVEWITQAETAQRRLSDGSEVVLNKHSTLSYPETFRGEERTVELKGEGFFTVTPDKTHPFLVKVGNVTVKVLGTSFNIRQQGATTEVIVASGLVEVSHADKKVLLHPRQKIVVSDSTTVLQPREEKDQLYQYYATRTFVCDNTPLWKLVLALEQAYGLKIEIRNPAIRELRLNTTFQEEPIERIIRIIEETFDIKASRNDAGYVLE